jgi:hypothetical protein
MKSFHSLRFLSLYILILATIVLVGCTPNAPFLISEPEATAEVVPTIAPTPVLEAMVTFRVELPEPLPPGDSIYLTILDEVTGLALNPTRYLMQAEDSVHFFVILPFELNTLLKYRYSRGSAQEHISDGRMVRYRMYRVDGPGLVSDIISRWTDTDFMGPNGRIQGQVVDADTGEPIPGLMVSAGGASTLSASNGSFLLEGLPPGTHNLVAYAMDGSYRMHQQGASVAAESTTPAQLELVATKTVQIEFVVTVPPGTIPATPIRFAGSLYQLGNTFSDLRGGLSLSASRMPVLQPLPDGRYSIILELPAGEDLYYRYTLGDGFWNAEHDRNGGIRVRRLEVPDQDTRLEDVIATWSNGPTGPITFDINVPEHTPYDEVVTLQLDPGFGWTEPIPMWPVGGNRWIYVLFSPLENNATLSYRYCRNGQCGIADDARTQGDNAAGFQVTPGEEGLTVKDIVETWVWLDIPFSPATVPNMNIPNRGPGFVAGIEFYDGYHPSWEAYMPKALGQAVGLYANWVILRPSWTYTRQNPPVLEPKPGADPMWADLVVDLKTAAALGMQTALFPTARFPGDATDWWQEAERDFAWWVAWFERYSEFVLHHADLAERHGAAILILGEKWITPALPDGLVEDGSSSRVPEDAEERWRTLLEEVRSRYHGKLLWAMPFVDGTEIPPVFVDEFDQIYLMWSAPLTDRDDGDEAEMTAQAVELLETAAYPLYEETGKRMVLGLAYASAKGGANGLRIGSEQVERDLQEQVDAYNAMMVATNQVEWVEGIVSRGYYPSVSLQDAGLSVNGKPARGVLWHWYQRLVGE